MGLFKNNNKGFTLVEVMMAAGIMGVMAVFFYKFFADQIKQQKTVMMKMEEGNLVNEIRILLMNQDNCAETFKDQVLNVNSEGVDKLEVPINDLKKVYTKLVPGKDPEKEIVEKYLKWLPGEQEQRYGQNILKISNYSISFSEADEDILKNFKRGEITFKVTFDRGKNKFGNKTIDYKIPLEVEVDDSKKLLYCSSMGLPAGGEAGIVTLDPVNLPALNGKTGNDACKSKSLACAYVQSTNYVKESSGIDAPLYSPACASSYNQSLQGVKDGVFLSNIHSCDARIGTYETFDLTVPNSVVTCAANFIAVCN